MIFDVTKRKRGHPVSLAQAIEQGPSCPQWLYRQRLKRFAREAAILAIGVAIGMLIAGAIK